MVSFFVCICFVFFSDNKPFKAYANSTKIVETLLKEYDKRIRPGVKGK